MLWLFLIFVSTYKKKLEKIDNCGFPPQKTSSTSSSSSSSHFEWITLHLKLHKKSHKNSIFFYSSHNFMFSFVKRRRSPTSINYPAKNFPPFTHVLVSHKARIIWKSIKSLITTILNYSFYLRIAQKNCIKTFPLFNSSLVVFVLK